MKAYQALGVIAIFLAMGTAAIVTAGTPAATTPRPHTVYVNEDGPVPNVGHGDQLIIRLHTGGDQLARCDQYGGHLDGTLCVGVDH